MGSHPLINMLTQANITKVHHETGFLHDPLSQKCGKKKFIVMILIYKS